jgi:hypothetical protein
MDSTSKEQTQISKGAYSLKTIQLRVSHDISRSCMRHEPRCKIEDGCRRDSGFKFVACDEIALSALSSSDALTMSCRVEDRFLNLIPLQPLAFSSSPPQPSRTCFIFIIHHEREVFSTLIKGQATTIPAKLSDIGSSRMASVQQSILPKLKRYVTKSIK